MTAFPTIDSVFRDNVVKGDIHSGAHNPDKPEIRSLLKGIAGAASNPSIVKGTKAALLATVPANENYGGLVLTGVDAGYYYRSGAAWVFGRGFPDTFANITLGGSANAQTGSVSAGVNPSTVLVYIATVTTENTGPMTLSIAGGTARDVVNAAGNALSAGEWTGTVLFYLNPEGDYQLLFDAGAVAAAAASATAADSARILAQAAAAAAGEGVAPASTRSVLAGLNTSAKTTALLKESGREGLFAWDASNLSASVTIDTAQGDFVPPTGTPSGASGAWKRIRKMGDLFKTSEFGDSLAVAVAVAAHRGGGVVEVNKRGTVLLGTGLVIPPTVQLIGLGSGITTIGVDASDWTSSSDFVAKSYAGLSAGWGMFFDDGNDGVRTVLPSFTTTGTKETSILFGSAHGLAVGDHIQIENTADWSLDGYRSVDRAGEHNIVVAIEGNRVHLLYELQDAYVYSSTVKAWKMPSVHRRIGGFTFDMTNAPDAGTDWGGIKVLRAKSGQIDDIALVAAKYTGIELEQCIGLEPTNIRASTRINVGSTYMDYALMSTSCRDIRWERCEGAANWAGADNGGWGNAGAVPNDDVIYSHSKITAHGTSPAASMHPNARRCGYEDCAIEGGLMQSGIDPIGRRNTINVRRGNNQVAILGSEITRGRIDLSGTRVRSQFNAGATLGQGCVRIRTEASRNGGGGDTIGGADGPVEIVWDGGELYATSETVPVYVEELSDHAPISIDFDITVQVDSVGNDGLIRALKSSSASEAGYFRLKVANYYQAKPYARWDTGYSALEKVFPRQAGTWTGTSPSAASTVDSIINLPHAYPSGYPVKASADLIGIDLGNDAFAKVRSVSTTQIRPQIGRPTNFPATTGFRVDWEAY